MIPEESGNKEAFLSLHGLFYYLKRSRMRTIHFLFASRLVEAKL
jgi:hypothetical protein